MCDSLFHVICTHTPDSLGVLIDLPVSFFDDFDITEFHSVLSVLVIVSPVLKSQILCTYTGTVYNYYSYITYTNKHADRRTQKYGKVITIVEKRGPGGEHEWTTRTRGAGERGEYKHERNTNVKGSQEEYEHETITGGARGEHDHEESVRGAREGHEREGGAREDHDREWSAKGAREDHDREGSTSAVRAREDHDVWVKC